MNYKGYGGRHQRTIKIHWLKMGHLIAFKESKLKASNITTYFKPHKNRDTFQRTSSRLHAVVRAREQGTITEDVRTDVSQDIWNTNQEYQLFNQDCEPWFTQFARQFQILSRLYTQQIKGFNPWQHNYCYRSLHLLFWHHNTSICLTQRAMGFHTTLWTLVGYFPKQH